MGIRARAAVGDIIRTEKTVGTAVAEIQPSAGTTRSGSIGSSSAGDASIRVGVTAGQTGRVARYADIADIRVEVDQTATSAV